jgi:hypothetical protein
MKSFKVKFSNRIEYQNKQGQTHRTNGPAIEWINGSKSWWINGKRHRTDGPAIEYNNGNKIWWINGNRHREDGPAVEGYNGYKEWYLNGIEYTEQEYYQEITNIKLKRILDL